MERRITPPNATVGNVKGVTAVWAVDARITVIRDGCYGACLMHVLIISSLGPYEGFPL